MFQFIITYDDGAVFSYAHVIEVSYAGSSSLITVPTEQLANHSFPVGKYLWLRTNTGSLSVNGSGVRLVEVRKE